MPILTFEYFLAYAKKYLEFTLILSTALDSVLLLFVCCHFCRSFSICTSFSRIASFAVCDLTARYRFLNRVLLLMRDRRLLSTFGEEDFL